jgi:hypothetical protein
VSDIGANPVLRAAIIVLAVVGAISVLSVAGMALMHGSMMGGFGC